MFCLGAGKEGKYLEKEKINICQGEEKGGKYLEKENILEKKKLLWDGDGDRN